MVASPFFPVKAPLTVEALAGKIGARLVGDGERLIDAIAPLTDAGSTTLAFAGSGRRLAELERTRAGAVIVREAMAGRVPETASALIVTNPERAFAAAGRALFPAALRPQSLSGETGVSPQAFVHPDAEVEEGATIEPFAVVGPGSAIGRGSIVGPGAAIGPCCRLGRDCSVGAGATLQACLVGDRVIVHPGVRIGSDGFGFVGGPAGHEKLVQIGRVVIQDEVEVGVNSTIDRGAMADTVIGEGTKIDNLVQIGHNARIGRHCILVSHVVIGGSAELGDFAVIGGGAAVNSHIVVGDRAQIAAFSAVARNVPVAARWGGIPARPMRAFLRDVAELNARAFGRDDKGDADG